MNMGMRLFNTPRNTQSPHQATGKRNGQHHHLRLMLLHLKICKLFQPLEKDGIGRFKFIPQLSKGWKAGRQRFGIARKSKVWIQLRGRFGKVIEIKAGQIAGTIVNFQPSEIPTQLRLLLIGMRQIFTFRQIAPLGDPAGGLRIAVLQKRNHLCNRCAIRFDGLDRNAQPSRHRQHPLHRKETQQKC